MTAQTRHPSTCEADVRMAWWLAEFGRFPTRDALRRIRQHLRAERKAKS
jgi:hypothetical protein